MNRLIASTVSSARVRAASNTKSAIGALVMYSLLPSICQPPSTLRARVFKARTFEPPSGSDRPKAAILSPASAGRKYCSFCCAVPAFQIGQMPKWLCADQLDAKL